VTIPEHKSKTIVAYLIAAGLVFAGIALGAVFTHWPQIVLDVLGVAAGLYLYHLLAQAVRASLP
jgi:hypothetical protein